MVDLQNEILNIISSAKWSITFSLADKKPDLHNSAWDNVLTNCGVQANAAVGANT